MMKQLVVGIAAHVDAGKTTLAESLLYLSGSIRKPGRVDKGNVFLDTHELEKARGITIFSKQARFELGNTEIVLLDTPGHIDFSAEMERTLQVLDYCILVISGADGVQSHTKTLWRLLARYGRPVFLFINKMDHPAAESTALMGELKGNLSENCVDFGLEISELFWEELALCQDELMRAYLKRGKIDTELITRAVQARKVFPCFFGSALRMEGVERFMQGLAAYTAAAAYPEDFGTRVYKISRDEQGQRLTHLKIVGGSLRVKDSLRSSKNEEKVNQIRLYSGERYSVVNEVQAGQICAVAGPSETRPGQGFGVAAAAEAPFLEPVLSYRVLLPAGYDSRRVLPMLREIEEEHPELRIEWHEQLEELQVKLMGEIQVEVLQSLIEERFGVEVEFDAGGILYKETIAAAVEGVGHFEPLRHYAEVHLLLEPGKPGSGLEFAANCSREVLTENQQKLILSYLQEKTHLGVLTGSPITDLRITLLGGKAHDEYTQGGDFKEAAYRAVRQGLKQADSRLLEPYYYFELEVPEKSVGRALTDLERMNAEYEIAKRTVEAVLIAGTAPVAALRHYQREVITYTKGEGRLLCSVDHYGPCRNTAEVLSKIKYDSERDRANPTGSIFCSQGSAFYVSWDEVERYMHVGSYLPKPDAGRGGAGSLKRPASRTPAPDEEIDYELLKRTISGNWGKKRGYRRKPGPDLQKRPSVKETAQPEAREEYLLVDGYNIIHAWPGLQEFAVQDMDVARGRLLNILAGYGEIRKTQIMVVFDAYQVPGRLERTFDFPNLQVVFTKEGQTADQYIEKFAHENKAKYKIRLATSDSLQRTVARGAGCLTVSAEEFKAEVELTIDSALKEYARKGNLLDGAGE